MLFTNSEENQDILIKTISFLLETNERLQEELRKSKIKIEELIRENNSLNQKIDSK